MIPLSSNEKDEREDFGFSEYGGMSVLTIHSKAGQ